MGEPREVPLLLTHRLARVASALLRVTASVHKQGHGLTVPEFNVLLVLGKAGDAALTSSAIVEMTAMDKTKVSRAVSALDARGWVRRERREGDRRFEYLTLKEEGRRVFEDLLPQVEKAEDEILHRLSANEMNALQTGLKGLNRSLSD